VLAKGAIRETEHFKVESPHILPLPHPVKRMDDKMDLKNAHIQIPNHQESQNLLQLQWELITSSVSHLGLLKGDEACDGNPQIYGNPSRNIPRQSLDTASGEGRADLAHSFNFPRLALNFTVACSV